MNSITLVLLLAVGAAIAIPSPILKTIRRGVRACDTEDPMVIEPGPIDITVDPFLVIDIDSEQFGAIATGLSGLETEVSYNAILQQISFKVTLPYAHIVGDRYKATGSINAAPIRPVTIPSGPFNGDGKFEASVNDFVIEGKANILVNLITNRVNLRSVTVAQLSFSKVFAELGGFNINGAPMDFDAWNAVFKTNFDADFNTPAIKNEILEKVKIFGNEILGQYTLAELLAIILKPAPTCAPRHK